MGLGLDLFALLVQGFQLLHDRIEIGFRTRIRTFYRLRPITRFILSTHGFSPVLLDFLRIVMPQKNIRPIIKCIVLELLNYFSEFLGGFALSPCYDEGFPMELFGGMLG